MREAGRYISHGDGWALVPRLVHCQVDEVKGHIRFRTLFFGGTICNVDQGLAGAGKQITCEKRKGKKEKKASKLGFGGPTAFNFASPVILLFIEFYSSIAIH